MRLKWLRAGSVIDLTDIAALEDRDGRNQNELDDDTHKRNHPQERTDDFEDNHDNNQDNERDDI